MRTALILVFVAVLPLGGLSAQEEAQPPAAEKAPATEEAEKLPSVAASAICLGVEEHEPVEPGDSFAAGVDRLYCWTKIEGAAESSVVHAWIHEGTTRARVELNVGSDSWRTYSTKQILPAWTGSWEVKVLTPQGAVLHSIPFTVGDSEDSAGEETDP